MEKTPPRGFQISTKSQESYANPFTVKLPLLRVAHPTDDDKNREVEKVRKEIEKSRQSKNLVESVDSDDLARNTSIKGVPNGAAAGRPTSGGKLPYA